MFDFSAADLSAAVRLELVDAAGQVRHVVGAGCRPAASLTRAELAMAGTGWRMRLFDAEGALLADLPVPTRSVH